MLGLYFSYPNIFSSQQKKTMPKLFTSQKNSLPRSPQNHDIQETSSELLIVDSSSSSRSTSPGCLAEAAEDDVVVVLVVEESDANAAADAPSPTVASF